MDELRRAAQGLLDALDTRDEANIHGWTEGIRVALAARSEPGARGLDVEDVMDAEHRYCVQVEGEWALGHEVERHRAQAEFIVAHLSDGGPTDG